MRELKLCGILNDGSRELEVNVDELVYRSYKYQRDRCPEIQPDRWAMCFDRTNQLEERYQKEKAPAATEAKYYKGSALANQFIH